MVDIANAIFNAGGQIDPNMDQNKATELFLGLLFKAQKSVNKHTQGHNQSKKQKESGKFYESVEEEIDYVRKEVEELCCALVKNGLIQDSSQYITLAENINSVSLIKTIAEVPGFDPNSGHSQDAMRNSIILGRIEVFEALLRSGINITQRDSLEESDPYRHIPTLLDNKSDYALTKTLVNLNSLHPGHISTIMGYFNEDSRITCVILRLIEKQDIESVRDLIGLGFDSTLTSSGLTPLMMASIMGDQEMVDFLLDDAALRKGEELGEFLNSQYPPQQVNALHCAAMYGHANIVQILLERHPDPEYINSTCANNEDALHFTIRNGKDDALQVLLSHPLIKISPIALHIAACHEHRNSFDSLLTTIKSMENPHALIDFQDKNGDTPLILAARKGHEYIATQLLESGAYKL